MEREPYTLRDLMTISRLAGADVNWFAAFPLLRSRREPNWPDLWRQAIELGTSGPASIKQQRKMQELERLLLGSGRSGSNSVVISAEKSATGYGMIANDPHLAFPYPTSGCSPV